MSCKYNVAYTSYAIIWIMEIRYYNIIYFLCNIKSNSRTYFGPIMKKIGSSAEIKNRIKSVDEMKGDNGYFM